ncbi:MAG: cytochrome c [Myxococcota bacterium]
MTTKYSVSTVVALLAAAALAGGCDSEYAAKYKYPTTPAKEVPAGTLPKKEKKAPVAVAKAKSAAPKAAETKPAAPKAAETKPAAPKPAEAPAADKAPAAEPAEVAAAPEATEAAATEEAAAAEEAPAGGEAVAAIDPATMKLGEQTYAVCMACHQATGLGLAGAFPPLVGSEWVLGDPARPIAIVINGLMGEIEVKGTKYNNVMAGLGGALKDEQIAAVLTYVRNSWGNSAPAVDVALVTAIREELKGTSMWNGGDAVTAFAEGRK